MFRNKPNTIFPELRKITKEQAINYLVDYLSKYNCLKAKDLENLDKYFDLRTIRKNDYFFKEKDLVEEIGFIVHGAIKQYRIHDNNYHVVYLLTEAQMSSSNSSWYFRKKSDQNAQCVEDSLLLVINQEGIRKIVTERPVFLKFFADLTAEVCIFYEERMTTFQMMDAQKRYEDLQKKSPGLFTRFSLQDIANYIGIKPETLSRIRSTALKKAS